jgi:hypothetical protein
VPEIKRKEVRTMEKQEVNIIEYYFCRGCESADESENRMLIQRWIEPVKPSLVEKIRCIFCKAEDRGKEDVREERARKEYHICYGCEGKCTRESIVKMKGGEGR